MSNENIANLYPSLSSDEEEPVKEAEEQKQEEKKEEGSREGIREEKDERNYPASLPHKIIKTNEGESNVSLPPKVCLAPPIFGGRTFAPPPPPPNAKKYTPPPVSMPLAQSSRPSSSTPEQRPATQGPRP